MKLISTKLTNLVSLEQSQLKPIGSWDCSNYTRLVSLEEMSFTDPRGGLKYLTMANYLRVVILVPQREGYVNFCGGVQVSQPPSRIQCIMNTLKGTLTIFYC